MKLGISTACFYPLPIEQALDEIGKLGLRTAEIFFNTESEYFEPLISKIERHVKENGLEICSIHPFTSANEGILLFSEYTRRTEDALAQYRRYFEAGQRLGAKYFTFHGERRMGFDTDGGIIDRKIKVYRRLIEAAAEHLAKQMLLTIPSLREVELEVKKPWAPIGLPVDFVSVKINRKWHTAYIAVGSNMGDRQGYLDMAADEIDADENCVLLKIADAIETKPYGMENQADFLNSCMEVRTLYQPRELLHVCKRIEKRANRVKTVHWGPRTLDLDIIFYDDEVVSENDLAIPHVEMHKREFVLRPLAQIAPNKIHPLLQKRVVDILKELNLE